ncbi:DoxX family protein [Staphylococcus sp. SQ8-PEA]|uniref:DoxX family protein n=1 Tax=Staphylococcus marylandisciuri TaxID=2981529 RepID=A0ABT2QMI9_9STAP|nr:DoxX family protein [Staphylococcus marylandisciuri]MCU5745201.1 DoxX family protein [Staphylococcus marylandisciuri]
MILRYITNLKLAKELFNASQPKLKGKQEMKDSFENEFGLPAKLVPVVGAAEALSSVLFAVSFASKTLSRIASLITVGVLSGAILKHFQAGHGKEGAKHAMDLSGLAILSFLDTLNCKKDK